MATLASVIEIRSLPRGEAPEWVRKAWIGCVLPCLPSCGHIPEHTEGLLTGVRLMKKVDGFDVPQGIALRVLEVHSPKAARWFEERGFPKKKMNFRFARKEVEVLRTVPEKARGKLIVYDDMETGSWRRVL